MIVLLDSEHMLLAGVVIARRREGGEESSPAGQGRTEPSRPKRVRRGTR